jgi:hypothetical protein
MSKKIFIIGDSWGVGAYKYAGNPPTAIEPIENTGLDFFLKNDGFEVKNFSKSATNNLQQLESLSITEESADLIIWFHTEVTRDLLYKTGEGSTYSELSAYAIKRNFDLAEKIYADKNIPFIVIGCLSPVSDIINNYSFVKTVITSWLDDLTEHKYKLPISLHTNNFKDFVEKYNPSDYQFMTSEMDKMIYLETKLETHRAFSQGVHPSKDSFYKLAERVSCLL